MAQEHQGHRPGPHDHHHPAPTGHGHGGHGHHGDTDLDWAVMAPLLESQAELFAPLYRQVMAWLAEQAGDPGVIVDTGSGPGVVAGLFAECFPKARVVAVDGSAPLLERARERAARLGHADRFTTVTGDLPAALVDLDAPADLLWASNSLHHLGDQRAALTAFAGHLAPGGTLALLEGGLPARFLPRDIGIGRPGLQARLDAIEADWFTRMRQDLPGSVAETEDWPALLAAAGLKPTGTRSFLLDLPAPVSAQARAYVADTLARLREGMGDALEPEDRAALDRLLDPDDEASVHRRRDLFVLKAHTVYTAVRV
ncbi:methyltransferase domain-containing protein [Streptomyces mexicanus]|uniref:Methyltransferase domain-containing protein n=2 Tax=Streptomyces mexicanus TaxID=178566 RepID=A0A7X1LPS1_9ACTN|nr:class I SAM-dependent methyltransferase [Streptomyces mexicanus]MBC2865330.1 methyltransferase domain-containing protein [Streptomyces mexicanus]